MPRLYSPLTTRFERLEHYTSSVEAGVRNRTTEGAIRKNTLASRDVVDKSTACTEGDTPVVTVGETALSAGRDLAIE